MYIYIYIYIYQDVSIFLPDCLIYMSQVLFGIFMQSYFIASPIASLCSEVINTNSRGCSSDSKRDFFLSVAFRYIQTALTCAEGLLRETVAMALSSTYEVPLRSKGPRQVVSNVTR